jgi:antibiotic biosynthesis monooxygenase (ABM) superfamily enzyme
MTSDKNKISSASGEKFTPQSPKWKSAALTFLAIYPMILFLPGLLEPFLKTFPAWLEKLILVLIVVVLMTWVVMPVLKRFFEKRLDPR